MSLIKEHLLLLGNGTEAHIHDGRLLLEHRLEHRVDGAKVAMLLGPDQVRDLRKFLDNHWVAPE